jgi:hypothetical protein
MLAVVVAHLFKVQVLEVLEVLEAEETGQLLVVHQPQELQTQVVEAVVDILLEFLLVDQA